MKPVALRLVDGPAYGGKAVALGALMRAGVRVPGGVALPAPFVELLLTGDALARQELAAAAVGLQWPVAVRSSAGAEDSAQASHAGQFLTKLQVASHADLEAAVREVADSAAPAAEYRAMKGIRDPVAMGVVVQTMLAPTIAGVMFTSDPISGGDDVLIEASWGLGESVVGALVVPDSFRIARSGDVVERRPGEKTTMLVGNVDGGTSEIQVSPDRVAELSLSDPQLRELFTLGLLCESIFGRSVDVEWAFVGATLFALQSRPITTGARL